jgi:hypothetical protein
MLELVPGRWTFTRYELPTLDETYTIEVPSGDPDRAGWFPSFGAADDGPVVFLSEGLLTAWDRHTGRLVGGPTRIGTTPTMSVFGQQIELGWVRPEHDGQMAFLAPDLSVQLWDAVTGARLTTIPTAADASGDVRFDLTGERMAVLTPARTIELWDVDTATLLRPPIPAPQVGALVGFAADGYLAVKASDLSTVDLLDVERGFVSGSLGLPITAGDQLQVERIVTTAPYSDGMPLEVPVIGDEWFAGLCAVADRPFTPAERGLLPEGVDTDPPCS